MARARGRPKPAHQLIATSARATAKRSRTESRCLYNPRPSQRRSSCLEVVSEANSWVIKKNCSAGPRQLALVFGSLVAISFAFGAAFAAFGFWMVLPFVGLELLAVGAAFVCYGRHAADYERITVTPAAVAVERVDGSCTAHWKLDPRSSRVHVDVGNQRSSETVHVFLLGPDLKVELGRHLIDARRRRLARELDNALMRARAAHA